MRIHLHHAYIYLWAVVVQSLNGKQEKLYAQKENGDSIRKCTMYIFRFWWKIPQRHINRGVGNSRSEVGHTVYIFCHTHKALPYYSREYLQTSTMIFHAVAYTLGAHSSILPSFPTSMARGSNAIYHFIWSQLSRRHLPQSYSHWQHWRGQCDSKLSNRKLWLILERHPGQARENGLVNWTP